MKKNVTNNPYPFRNPSSCSRCPYNQTRSPCFECPSSVQLSNAGKCWLSLDALPTNLRPDIEPTALSGRIADDGVTNMPPEAEYYTRKLLAVFSSLPSEDVMIVHGLLNGLTMGAIGERYFGGITKQAVGSRIRKLVKRHPWMTSLSPRRKPPV